jgi:hypothetical protein
MTEGHDCLLTTERPRSIEAQTLDERVVYASFLPGAGAGISPD